VSVQTVKTGNALVLSKPVCEFGSDYM